MNNRRELFFRQALHDAVNKQRISKTSYLLGDSSGVWPLSRIVELYPKANGVLEERNTLTEVPNIEWCRIVRVASELPWPNPYVLLYFLIRLFN